MNGDGLPLAISLERLAQDWKAALRRVELYLRALAVPEGELGSLARGALREAAERESWQRGATAMSETLDAARALAKRSDEAPADLPWIPPLRRGSMPPRPLRERAPLPKEAAPTVEAPPPTLPWRTRARLRRLALLTLVLAPACAGALFMHAALPQRGFVWLEGTISVLYGVLLGWVSIGFWTALFGVWTLLRRKSVFAVGPPGGAPAIPIAELSRTAVVMPICEEPVARVFAGLRAVYRSLERAGALAPFDLFILSDSREGDTCLAEERAWLGLCRELDAFGRLFYRRRRIHQKRKSGNIADFCRRWGRSYRYMIVLDADSVMSGDTLVELVRRMEAHPDVGILQTAPIGVHRRSLFGRIQQFSSRVYGPLFTAGLHFWQLGDGQYWGHNAILRIEPFMHYCGLSKLPGKPPLGGEILSHDFVEAALLARGGYTLWLAHDLGGSFEETPSSLLDELNRDRRWCQGNLQHLRLLSSEGLRGAHRALFLNGALSYVSALLWFAFLLATSSYAVLAAVIEPDYFPDERSLFPVWPEWHPQRAAVLLGTTLIVLFLPKLLGLLRILVSGQARKYGGVLRLLVSAFSESAVASLLAPIRMGFHARFVLANLLGFTVSWSSQPREDRGTELGMALRRHGVDTLIGLAWALVLYVYQPTYALWALPIAGALVLAIPLSVLTSFTGLGEGARRLGLFLIPEETSPPVELRELEAADPTASPEEGFVRAIVDPDVNALHVSYLRGLSKLPAGLRARRDALIERAAREGPEALDREDRRILLDDSTGLAALHRRVWSLEDREQARRWLAR